MFLLEVSLLLRYKMKFGQNGVKKNLFSSCLTPYLLRYLLPNNYKTGIYTGDGRPISSKSLFQSFR